ncbi:2Fe-2S ferredoxin-type domain-containing protein [Haematococcus lacustris]
MMHSRTLACWLLRQAQAVCTSGIADVPSAVPAVVTALAAHSFDMGSALPGSSASGHSAGRAVHTSAKLCSDVPSAPGETISVTFVDKDGLEHNVPAPIGKNLLEVAHDNEVDLEGACEGSLACSTCHVIVENEEYYKKLPEPCEDELDMLDLAFGLSETSRLGCQVIAARELDGIRVRIPAASRNFYVDGHKPKPH